MSGEEDLIAMLRQDAANRFLAGDPGALEHSVAMKPGDAAHWMLTDGKTSTPVVHRDGCYICEDPEYAVMGLPLCMKCARCGGHIPADDETCDDCGWCVNPFSQGPGDSLAPGGGDGGWPGDFETAEPFLVPRGTTDYAGLPEFDGDLWDQEEKGEGDYVESLSESVPWRGIVTGVKGYPVQRYIGGEFVPGFEVTECTVRVDDPAGGRSRLIGDVVHCRPGWLRVIRKKEVPPPWEK